MKIKNVGKLQDLLDEDFIWRKKELIDCQLLIHSTDNKMLCRMGIALLCAHFEGFIKQAANYYIVYVSSQNIKLSELKINFNALHSANIMKNCNQTEKISVYNRVIEEILSNYEEKNFNVKYSKDNPIIKTGGNPSSTVLKEILLSIGLDFSPYEMKKNYIDTDLLSNRHGIVHGEKRFISIEDFDGTLYQVMEIMDSVRDQILDAAINKDYKK